MSCSTIEQQYSDWVRRLGHAEAEREAEKENGSVVERMTTMLYLALELNNEGKALMIINAGLLPNQVTMLVL